MVFATSPGTFTKRARLGLVYLSRGMILVLWGILPDQH